MATSQKPNALDCVAFNLMPHPIRIARLAHMALTEGLTHLCAEPYRRSQQRKDHLSRLNNLIHRYVEKGQWGEIAKQVIAEVERQKAVRSERVQRDSSSPLDDLINGNPRCSLVHLDYLDRVLCCRYDGRTLDEMKQGSRPHVAVSLTGGRMAIAFHGSRHDPETYHYLKLISHIIVELRPRGPFVLVYWFYGPLLDTAQEDNAIELVQLRFAELKKSMEGGMSVTEAVAMHLTPP